jgi:hypothetical protein
MAKVRVSPPFAEDEVIMFFFSVSVQSCGGLNERPQLGTISPAGRLRIRTRSDSLVGHHRLIVIRNSLKGIH